MRQLFHELKRRNVYRVAVTYAAVAFVTLQAAKLIFPATTLEGAYDTLVLVAFVGFPIALVIAWAFELTPEGVRPSGQVGPGEEAAGRSGVYRAVLPLALVAVVGAGAATAGWLAWDRWLAPNARDASAAADSAAEGEDVGLPATRIAVLYFDDHSESQDLEHVAAGFTESLIHELAQAPGLDVVSRNGVKAFRDPDVPLDSVARALGAGSLVEGSVEREGNQLVVTVQLVDGNTTTHLVSERVRGRVDAPLEVRNDLVERVAALLRRELGHEVQLRKAKAGTESSRAWELYHGVAREFRSDANSFRQDGNVEAAGRLYLQADSVLARVEELDPGWQAPTLQRAEIAVSLGRLGSPEVTKSREEWLRRGIEHVNRILSKDPDHAAALELRGETRYYLARTQKPPAAERTMQAAERDLRRAVSLDSDRAAAWARLAYLLWNQEARLAEARSAIRQSRKADPFLTVDRDYLYMRASLALDMEEFQRADRLLAEALDRYPDAPSFLFKRLQYLASTASSRDDVEEAWDALGRFEAVTRTEPWPPGRALVAATAAHVGLADSARSMLDQLGRGASMSPNAAVNVAYARLLLGEEDEALDHLARYLEANPSQRDYVAREWWWRPLRDHPEFHRLVGDTAVRTADTIRSGRG